MLNVSDKNSRKMCEICPGVNYSEKNVWGRIPWAEILREDGWHFPERN